MRLTLLIAASVMVAAPAIAQDEVGGYSTSDQYGTYPNRPEGSFDPNFQWGGVFALPPEERFAAIDADSDGKITKAEYLAVLNPDAAPSINTIWRNRDRDENGWLDQEELTRNSGRPAFGRR